MSEPRKGRGARERILKTVERLFYREGVRAVGVDRVVAESDVAKTTLYAHFPSKEDLIAAYLEHQHVEALRRLGEGIRQLARDPRGRILAVFELLDVWFGTEHFRGCAFTNAGLEMGGESAETRERVRAHKLEVARFLRTLAEEGKAPDPDALSEELMILYEGAITTASLRGGPGPGLLARRMAARVLDDALPQA